MAQTITHKHSNNPDERPNSRQLALGEIGINSSDQSPGLFTPLTDGTISKIGPIQMGSSQPILNNDVAGGEEWFDLSNEELKIWESSQARWIPTSHRNTNTVLVDSLSPNSSDELLNNGQNRPFRTLNRACLEITKRLVLNENPTDTNYTILLQSSDIAAINDPGLALNNFRNENEPLNNESQITHNMLIQLNALTGGIVVPPNTSIRATNPNKTTIRPTYTPPWAASTYADLSLSATTAILKWTDRCSVDGLNFSDKRESIVINQLSKSDNGNLVLKSTIPHTFSSTQLDQIELYYVQTFNNSNNRIPLDTYLIKPIDSFRFELVGANNETISYNSFISQTSVDLDQGYLLIGRGNTTHHRVSIIEDGSDQDVALLNNKISHLYSQLRPANSTIIETSSIPQSSGFNINYVTNLSLNTRWGLNGIKSNKTIQIDGFLYSAQQNDPQVYEIYSNGTWSSLSQIYNDFAEALQDTPLETPETPNIPTETPQNPIEFLKTISSENIRFFYRYADSSTGEIDPKSDTRFYGLVAGQSSFVEAYRVIESDRSVSAGFLTKQGGHIGFSNSKLNSIRTVGFSTTSRPEVRGFEIIGLRRPLNIPQSELERSCSFEKIYINLPIHSIATTSSTDFTATELTLAGQLNPQTDLLPYVLQPGDLIYADWLDSGISFNAAIPENDDNWLTISADSNTEIAVESPNIIPAEAFDVADFGLPYIRRFVDNRPVRDRHYYFHIRTTQENRQPPQVGDILQLVPSTQIQPGSQLSPTKAGGWNNMFYVADVLNRFDIDRDNLQYSQLSDQSEYYISLGLIDNSEPWTSLVSDTDTFSRAKGTYITRRNNIYQSIEHDLVGNSLEDTVWLRNNNQIISQNRRPDFPNQIDYSDTNPTFARGLTTSLANYRVKNLINSDPQNITPESNKFLPSAISDPSWTHNRQATFRFLRLMGFPESLLNSRTLVPERPEKRLASWISDRLSVFTGNLHDGFAVSKAAIPVVFHRPSRITLDGLYSGRQEELWGGRGPNPINPSVAHRSPNTPPPKSLPAI